MSEFTVQSIEWSTASRAILSVELEPILSAVLAVGGHTLHVSHYPDELRDTGARIWCADAHFGANGMPHFSHGLGSRCTSKQTLSDDVAAALDAAADALPAPDQPTTDASTHGLGFSTY